MNQLLFDRSTGSLSSNAFTRIQSTHLIHDLQPSPNRCFDGGQVIATAGDDSGNHGAKTDVGNERSRICAHTAGVNALVIDRFDGRLLLSGGADSSISLWDLQGFTASPNDQILKPKGIVARNPDSHKYGVTQLSFYPFDSAAFLSTSYDHTLKVYATDSLTVSASFDLDSIIYTHALSPIASHLLVACATQHPAVRLVDLRSGSSAHSLAGHHGAVLSAAWGPTSEHILASGDTNGVVRVWDIRKSAGTLALLDMEDSAGINGSDGMGARARSRHTGKAHDGAVNGLSWTDDGAFIVTAGHDERIRVWDSATGANTLASFGPTLKNTHLSTLPMLITPTAVTPPGKGILVYPNEQELLIFLLHEGKLLKRFRIPGPIAAAVRSKTGERNIRNRVTSITWGGIAEGIYSGHSDGQIRAWMPNHEETDDEECEEDSENADDSSVKRKREVLDDIFRDLTRQKITFG